MPESLHTTPESLQPCENFHPFSASATRNSSQDEMTKMRASCPAESESIESNDEATQPKDLDVMTQVFGARSCYHKGYGAMPRLKVVGGNKAPSSRGAPQDHEKAQHQNG